MAGSKTPSRRKASHETWQIVHNPARTFADSQSLDAARARIVDEPPRLFDKFAGVDDISRKTVYKFWEIVTNFSKLVNLSGSKCKFQRFWLKNRARLPDKFNGPMLITREGIPDSDFSAELASFIAASEENALELGLSLSEISEMRLAFDEFDLGIVEVTTLKAQLHAAVNAKEAKRERAQRLVSRYAKRWRANDAIPDELLAQLMIAPHNPQKAVRPVQTVRELVATPSGLGEIVLRWNPNGNTRGTTYMIERASHPQGPWGVVDAVTKKSYKMLSQPGREVWFRVSAKRGGRSSIPCNPVGLWGSSEFDVPRAA